MSGPFDYKCMSIYYIAGTLGTHAQRCMATYLLSRYLRMSFLLSRYLCVSVLSTAVYLSVFLSVTTLVKALLGYTLR